MNSVEKWDVRVERSVTKTLRTFPRKDADAIEAAIISLEYDPYAGDIKKIGGEERAWRRRVGSYRISYEIYQNSRIVVVFKVKRRTSTTY